MSLEVDGLDEVIAKIRRTKTGLVEVTNQELKRTAEEVQKTARDMAPIDYGPLRQAIKIRRVGAQGEGGRFIKGMSNYDVYVDPSQPAPKRQEKNVGSYAWHIHEHMGWQGYDQPLMPSKKSVEAGNGEDPVGGKFLERAIIKHNFNFRVSVEKSIREYIHKQ